MRCVLHPVLFRNPCFILQLMGNKLPKHVVPSKLRDSLIQIHNPYRERERERETALNLITSSVWFLWRQIMTRKIESTGLVSWLGRGNPPPQENE